LPDGYARFMSSRRFGARPHIPVDWAGVVFACGDSRRVVANRVGHERKPPAEAGNRWALPIALLVLATYIVPGVANGGAERGWWS